MIVATACGLLAFAASLATVGGWHVWRDEFGGDVAPMQYVTAICVLFCCIGLVGVAWKLPRALSLIGGGVAGIVGLFTAVEYITGGGTIFSTVLGWLPAPPAGPSRPSPPGAVCLALCGTAVVYLGACRSKSRRRPVVWTLGAFALTLCMMAVCGYFTGLSGTYSWGPFIGMAFLSAATLGVLSIGILALMWMDGVPLAEDRWLPAPVGLATLTATLILWQALVSERASAIRMRSEVVARYLAAEMLQEIDTPVRALERMGRRWETRGGMPAVEWRDDVKAYLEDEGIVNAVEWVDRSLHVRWVVPEDIGAVVGGMDVTTDDRWNVAEALAKARRDGTIAVSPTVELMEGGRGFFVYRPLLVDGEFDGFLMGAFNLDSLTGALLKTDGIAGYSVQIFENNALIAQSPEPAAANGTDSAHASVDFHGHEWMLVVSPASAGLAAGGSRLPHLVLVIGVLFSAALTQSVRSMQQMQRHAAVIQSSNQKLEEEIEARARVEARLRETEERQRAVLDSATGVAVISTDTSGRILYFSKGAEMILGYSAEEMVGRETPARFHDTAEMTARAEELSRELGRPVEGFDVFVAVPRLRGRERREWTYICKNGARRIVDLTVTVLSGGSEGFLGTAIDITERKAAEQALRETLRAKETAQALLEAAGRIARLGYWSLRANDGNLEWSGITYAIHEIEPGAPITLEQAIAFYHPDDRQRISSEVQRLLRSGGEFDFETRVVTARGREIWIHVRGEAVQDESGAIVGLRGVIQDVDERRRAGELLVQRNVQLEAARAQAEAHARAKAEFLANMSHEIRTPLNAVVGMADLLMDAELPAHERELAETIRTSGDVLLGLINDILDFSKIESGQLDLERIPVNLRDCLESALDLVAGPAARKKLDLAYWIDPTVPPTILGDPTRLRQVVMNLLSNAIKFTSAGEVFVKVSRASGVGGDWLHVEVRDSGIGIPAEKRDRLFQAFSQVDSSTTRRFGGTGLGLAISRRLIDLMGGRIWVESEVGIGSTFHFEIPLQAAEVSVPATFGRRGVRSLEGMRVLIVEDNATNRWILQMQTASWGMTPIVAENCRQAIEHVRSGEPLDVALLDVRMPGMTGYDLAAEIRRHRSKENLPIVLLTSVDDTIVNLDDLGIAGVLSKPVKVTPLFNVLCGVLGDGVEPRPIARNGNDLARECPMRILVAEDNIVNQRVIELLLKRLGYRSQVVANGLEVLAALETIRPDVIFLDVQMPEMDGLETAREISRRFPADKRPWMIALTAHAIEGDRDDCLAAGMDDYLSKPIRRESLERALRKAFAAREIEKRRQVG